MRRWILGFVIAMLALGSSAGAAEFHELRSEPTAIKQGEIVEFKVSAEGLAGIEGQVGRASVRFYPTGLNAFAAVIGADLEAKPGVMKLSLETTFFGGSVRHVQIPMALKAKSFEQESFSVPTEFDQLAPEILQRIRSEQEQFDRTFAISAPEKLWSLPFIMPVDGIITSPFGYRRVINGTPRAPHTGVDLRAAIGTPVLAANHGRVALRGDFFFSGKTLILDHGSGLYTMYFHLSEFDADVGDEIQRGQIIALSGMTGRVNGPHLHWGARVNGARVDPFQLIEKLSNKADQAEAQRISNKEGD
jgi:murein DD-endopeptidase MepM/ murein hydrolase activator NlpD